MQITIVFPWAFSPRTCSGGEGLGPIAPSSRTSRAIAGLPMMIGSCGGTMDPGLRVVSGEFSEELGGCLIVKASQPGAIIVGDKAVQVGVAFGMVVKAAVVGGAVLRDVGEMLADAAVEAFDHAVGLRPERLGEAMGDGVAGAGAVERVLARGSAVGFSFLSTAKRSVNSEPLSVKMVCTGSGKPSKKRARKRARKPAAVSPRRSQRISR